MGNYIGTFGQGLRPVSGFTGFSDCQDFPYAVDVGDDWKQIDRNTFLYDGSLAQYTEFKITGFTEGQVYQTSFHVPVFDSIGTPSFVRVRYGTTNLPNIHSVIPSEEGTSITITDYMRGELTPDYPIRFIVDDNTGVDTVVIQKLKITLVPHTVLTVANLGGDPNYGKNAALGSISPDTFEGLEVHTCSSFGPNWFMVALGAAGDQIITGKNVKVTFPYLPGSPSGTLTPQGGINYGGTVTNIQALLAAVDTTKIPIILEAVT